MRLFRRKLVGSVFLPLLLTSCGLRGETSPGAKLTNPNRIENPAEADPLADLIKEAKLTDLYGTEIRIEADSLADLTEKAKPLLVWNNRDLLWKDQVEHHL